MSEVPEVCVSESASEENWNARSGNIITSDNNSIKPPQSGIGDARTRKLQESQVSPEVGMAAAVFFFSQLINEAGQRSVERIRAVGEACKQHLDKKLAGIKDGTTSWGDVVANPPTLDEIVKTVPALEPISLEAILEKLHVCLDRTPSAAAPCAVSADDPSHDDTVRSKETQTVAGSSRKRPRDENMEMRERESDGSQRPQFPRPRTSLLPLSNAASETTKEKPVDPSVVTENGLVAVPELLTEEMKHIDGTEATSDFRGLVQQWESRTPAKVPPKTNNPPSRALCRSPKPVVHQVEHGEEPDASECGAMPLTHTGKALLQELGEDFMTPRPVRKTVWPKPEETENTVAPPNDVFNHQQTADNQAVYDEGKDLGSGDKCNSQFCDESKSESGDEEDDPCGYGFGQDEEGLESDDSPRQESLQMKESEIDAGGTGSVTVEAETKLSNDNEQSPLDGTNEDSKVEPHKADSCEWNDDNEHAVVRTHHEEQQDSSENDESFDAEPDAGIDSEDESQAKAGPEMTTTMPSTLTVGDYKVERVVSGGGCVMSSRSPGFKTEPNGDAAAFRPPIVKSQPTGEVATDHDASLRTTPRSMMTKKTPEDIRRQRSRSEREKEPLQTKSKDSQRKLQDKLKDGGESGRPRTPRLAKKGVSGLVTGTSKKCRRMHRMMKELPPKNFPYDSIYLSEEEEAAGRQLNPQHARAVWASSQAKVDWRDDVRAQSDIDPNSIFGFGCHQPEFNKIFDHRTVCQAAAHSRREELTSNTGLSLLAEKWNQDAKKFGFKDNEGVKLSHVERLKQRLGQSRDVSQLLYDSKWLPCDESCDHNSAIRQPWFKKLDQMASPIGTVDASKEDVPVDLYHSTPGRPQEAAMSPPNPFSRGVWSTFKGPAQLLSKSPGTASKTRPKSNQTPVQLSKGGNAKATTVKSSSAVRQAGGAPSATKSPKQSLSGAVHDKTNIPATTNLTGAGRPKTPKSQSSTGLSALPSGQFRPATSASAMMPFAVPATALPSLASNKPSA